MRIMIPLVMALLPATLWAQTDYGTLLDVKTFRQQTSFVDPYSQLEDKNATPSKLPAANSMQRPSIHFRQDTTISIGMMMYANPYRCNWKNTRGYRVQIYNGHREGANNAQFDFLELRTREPVYLEYEAPNFKVRVGDFELEAEAQTFARQLQKSFAGAYVVPCEIELPGN